MSHCRTIPPVLLALVTTACTGSYEALLRDSDAPEFATLLAAGEEVEARVVRVPVGQADGEPVHVAVEERGTGRRSRVLAFVHGVASDRRTWRFVAGDLGRDHDLLLPDLPGCGESDCPEPGSRGPDDYAPDPLARDVLRAHRATLAPRAPDVKLTLVGHSLGGSMILRMLGDREMRAEFEDVLRRVDGIVLFSPLDFEMVKPDPVFLQMATIGGFEVWVGDAFGIVRGRLADVLRETAPGPDVPLREEVDRTRDYLIDGPRRRAMQAMLRQAVPFSDDGRLRWGDAEALVADYRNVDVPCLVVWGSRDESLPVSMGYELAAQLPDATLRIVPDATHGLPHERPVSCADLVRAFASR